MSRRSEANKLNAKEILKRFEAVIVKNNKGVTRRDLRSSDIKELFCKLGNSVGIDTIKKMKDGSKPRPPTVEDTAFMAWVILSVSEEEQLREEDIEMSDVVKAKLEELKSEKGEEPLSHDALLIPRLKKGKAKAPLKTPEDSGQPSSSANGAGDSAGREKWKKYTIKSKEMDLIVAMGAFHFKTLSYVQNVMGQSESDQKQEFESFMDQAKGCFLTVPDVTIEDLLKKVEAYFEKLAPISLS